MKLIVCDSDATVQSAFLSQFEARDVTFYESPVTDEILSAHPDATHLSLFVSSQLNASRIDMLPLLVYIGARSTGTDHIDSAYARTKGIVVSNVPRYGQRTVAEFTFALLLSLSRKIVAASVQIREHGDFAIRPSLEGFDLFGKTLGVIGTGAIGATVVSIARSFGMNVLMCDVRERPELAGDNARYVSHDELYVHSDIITLHAPYTKENHHLLSADAFAKMKEGVVIINTARGELIDTEALVDALTSGKVAGAGLDVLEEERSLKDEVAATKQGTVELFKSLIRDHVLVDMPNVIITPHIGFFSKEAYNEILSISIENVQNAIKAKPSNVVA